MEQYGALNSSQFDKVDPEILADKPGSAVPHDSPHVQKIPGGHLVLGMLFNNPQTHEVWQGEHFEEHSDQGVLFGFPALGAGTHPGNVAERIVRTGGSRVVAEHARLNSSWDGLTPERVLGEIGRLSKHITPHTFYGGDPELHKDVGIGMHWAHARDNVRYEQTKSGRPTVRLEAEHPGHEHVLNWDAPHDLPYLHAAVSEPQNRAATFSEIPIRPGTPLHIRKIEVFHPDLGPMSWDGSWKATA